MRRQSMVKRVGAFAVAGGMVLGLAGAAFAAGTATSTVTPGAGTSKTGRTLDTLRQTCEAAIDRRLTSLGALQGKVSSSTYLTAGDKASLVGEIGGENDG